VRWHSGVGTLWHSVDGQRSFLLLKPDRSHGGNGGIKGFAPHSRPGCDRRGWLRVRRCGIATPPQRIFWSALPVAAHSFAHQGIEMSNDARHAIDLEKCVIELDRNNLATVHDCEPGPPKRYEGYTIGAPQMTQAPPHDGEVHPDGDEILFLVAGEVTVILEDEEPVREVPMSPGDSLIVPRGVWHKVRLEQPSRLFHVTPGPKGAYRPLPD
jgi:mannose-6-phosphate isomerase-like protein (cupin superfamily)